MFGKFSRDVPPAFKIAAFLSVIVCAIHPLPSAQAAAPARVVSMNLCTDQLAMLLTGKEQLISVSYLAARESSSLMADQAKGIGTNHGLAEEIFRLKPDLVLAGTFTTRATVNLLKKLDIRVEEFPPAYSMEDIKINLLRMGELLGQQGRAFELQTQFERDLSLIKAEQTARQKVIGSYGANSYTSGFGTLENDIVKAAGLTHMGEALGVKGTIKLPLESLLRAQPDYIMSWQQWSERPGRSTEILHHPVLERSFGKERRLYADSRYWICGLPLVIEAIRHLQHQTQGQAHD
ncbi:MAG: ABC transporter substrate-binding protein [Cohaesibacter sp.]|nr:ABC transporter substrate-binding protein [Cohaesibacter sp.]